MVALNSTVCAGSKANARAVPKQSGVRVRPGWLEKDLTVRGLDIPVSQYNTMRLTESRITQKTAADSKRQTQSLTREVLGIHAL